MRQDKRSMWLCLAIVLTACEPNFIVVTVEKIPPATANLEINSKVNHQPRTTDVWLAGFANRQSHDASEWKYVADVDGDAKGKQYDLDIAALDQDGCSVRSGNITTTLDSPDGSAVKLLRVSLRDVPRVCKLQIEKLGDVSLDDVLVITGPILLNQKPSCRRIGSPICRMRPSVTKVATATEPLGDSEQEVNGCRAGCTCPQECKTPYRETDTATLTLRQIPGYKVFWESCGGGTIDPKLNSCTVEMKKRRSVKIIVEPIPSRVGNDSEEQQQKTWFEPFGGP